VTVRFCIACGARLRRVRQHDDRARPRCPRCGWTFYDNPVPAAICVIERRGAIVMVRRARPPYAGTWDLPGGFLEAGETPEAGLARELREELGVGVRRARLLGFATDRYGPAGLMVLTAIYRVVPDSWRFAATDDVSEVRWFPRGRLPYRRIAFPAMRRSLRAWIRGR
jgi:8-oxo-dGTP diphosphatase